MFSSPMFFSAPLAGNGIPQDFVARYLFDGDFTDETGNFDGTNSGSTFVGAGNGPNGTNLGIQTGGGKLVELGAALSAALGAGAGTISFAVKTLSTVANDSVIFAGADSGTSSAFLSYTIRNDTGKARGIHNSGNIYQSDDALTDNIWQHVIIRTNGSGTSFRVNGANSTKTVTAGSDTGAWFGDIASLDFTTIGQIRDLSPFSGVEFQVAFLTLFDRSITDDEAVALETEY